MLHVNSWRVNCVSRKNATYTFALFYGHFRPILGWYARHDCARFDMPKASSGAHGLSCPAGGYGDYEEIVKRATCTFFFFPLGQVHSTQSESRCSMSPV